MKTDKIFWGIFLVFIGGIFLLENFNIIDFSWSYIWRFWPVILILIGVNLLFKNSNSKLAILLTAVITIITLGFLAFKGLQVNHFDKREKDNTAVVAQTYSEDFDQKYKTATLNIKGGASKFLINDFSAKLFEADLSENKFKYYLKKIDADSTVVLNFNGKGKNLNYSFGDDDFNDINMKLSAQPVWNINLAMGAGEVDFDLTKFKTKDIKLEGGAASFRVKIGDLYNNISLSAETGLAEIKIEVPETSGCRIKASAGLSSKDFKGFKKLKDGSYETSNYNTSANKVNISLKGGLSDFNVDRY